MKDGNEAVAYLRTTAAIRTQCQKLYDLARADGLAHFALHEDKLPAVAALVEKVTRQSYPDLNVPYHSRWRHFDTGGLDRNEILDAMLAGKSPEEVARAKYELAIVSVLLDAGAGPDWKYHDARTGKDYARSEGLAVASFEMFVAGAFSGDAGDPLRVDPAGLRKLGKKQLAAGFQVSETNPLLGADGRLSLLNKLAHAVEAHPKHFGAVDPRLGGLVDYLLPQAANGKLPAKKILAAVLEGLGSIWPGRVTIAGVNMGDVWRHSKLDDYVPFHKLSQWLTYSLCEPLEELGLEVTHLDELTGLPEYRNGGLFLDTGVLSAKYPGIYTETHAPDSDAIVEWRALTVILLDKTAELIRKNLKLSAAELPLAKVLQGGTWVAGRQVAAEKRAGGGPPIKYVSDGTLF
jgi:hypothetical protein